ncbi:MAG TPA: AraC family transcriptional regulator [Candidatus Alistipes faecavium]|nr:AraC family transcriptional regulator [Candidatus Alistipes faecavium]
MIPTKNNSVLHEITPLSEADCIYVIERRKAEFNYPIHTHREFEINYIENAAGAQRVVGDSIEEIGDYELVLISSGNLEHGWQNHRLVPGNIREITIQFSDDWLSDKLLDKNQFHSIQTMFQKGCKGLSFSLATILRVRPLLNALTCESQGFYLVVTFLTLLYELSVSHDTRTLASNAFAHAESSIQSRRIRLADAYLQQNFARNVTLGEVAHLANMSEVAFSRFFSQHTGKSFTDYLIDIRIGKVARLLIDTNKTIAEICYECGYNNMSNFNRLFRRKKGCTPKEFRDMYRKKQVIV